MAPAACAQAFHVVACRSALPALQAKEVLPLRGGCPTASAFQHLAPLVITISVLMTLPPEHELLQNPHHLMDLCGSEWTDQDTALATQLEADLAAAGYDPLLTASEQQRLSMLLAPLGARLLEEGPPRPPHFVQLMRRVARRNSRRLMELHPDSASLKQLHAFVLSLDNSLGRQTVAAYRAALQAAEATNCELVGIGCGLVCICSWPDRMLASITSWLLGAAAPTTGVPPNPQPQLTCWQLMPATALCSTCCTGRRAPPGPWPRCAACCTRRSAASSAARPGSFATAGCWSSWTT